MEFTEEKAKELIAKYGVKKPTVNGWRRRKIIPDMYASDDAEKITAYANRPRNGGGRPKTGRTKIARNFYLEPQIVKALSALDTNQTQFVNTAIREKINKEIKKKPQIAEKLADF